GTFPFPNRPPFMLDSSKKTTLLFIGRDRLIRYDARGEQMVGLWQGPRSSREELPALVDTALRLTKSRPGKVWILATDVWTHWLSVPRESLQGLMPQEIGKALAFEAESLSGQSPLDSEIAYIPCGGDGDTREFRIVQLPTWLRDQLDQVVREAKGTLRGITHP